MSRKQRDTCIENFRLGKIWILICTDVMARGVDFKGVAQVSILYIYSLYLCVDTRLLTSIYHGPRLLIYTE